MRPELFVLIIGYVAVVNSSVFSFLDVFMKPNASSSRRDELTFYWNVPTFMCHKYGMYFEDVAGFGIKQNKKDEFRGDQVTILYDPGAFPALLKDETGKTIRRNGGVPQEGDMAYHMKVFEEHVDQQIADPNFDGLAVIDFESWRPIFRQNWASLAPYRDLSIDIERERHPFWDKNQVTREATRRFEKSGRTFMEETLRLAKRLRPKASWGYYAYPYCYNFTPNQPTAQCDSKASEENDRLSWLFYLQDVVLPSVYLRESLGKQERMSMISGRVKEAVRVSKQSGQEAPVLSYFWYKYQDKSSEFLTNDDVCNGFRTAKNSGANGIVLWGSSNDFKSREKCLEFKEYLGTVLGPCASQLA